MNKTVCVLYGITEGSHMGETFRAACREVALDVTSDPSRADIIFAHSGGCFLVPPKNQASLIVMVGLPYWPGRPWLFATLIKVWRECMLNIHKRSLGPWAIKLLHHVRYAFNLKVAWHMAKQQGVDNTWNSNQRQVIIRNRNDAYCSPGILQIPFRGPRTFISLPGEHDDCWESPKQYVEILMCDL